MGVSIEALLEEESRIFKDREVLSPHYVPEGLPHREEQVEKLLRSLVVAYKGAKPKNVFLYGKTGTGKTSVVRYVFGEMDRVERERGIKGPWRMYVNARIYSTRYKILQKVLLPHFPEVGKAGFGLNYFYEKLLELLSRGERIVVAVDEIDFVEELDDLLYTLIRVNDEAEGGFISIIGISNKLNFKDRLDPRTKSSLQELEVMFPPYNTTQLREILEQRARLAFREGAVGEEVINYIAMKAADETGDARYALKLLQFSAEIADNKGKGKVEIEDVKEAIRHVEYDMTAEAMAELIPQQKLVLYALAKMVKERKRQKMGEGDVYVFSGELYEAYKKVVKRFGLPPKTAKWVRKWVKDLEDLGLVSTAVSGKGIRGHTTAITLGVGEDDVIRVVERTLIGL